jgi:hypothetical protein
VTVVICAYTEARWAYTMSPVRSVLEQQPARLSLLEPRVSPQLAHDYYAQRP